MTSHPGGGMILTGRLQYKFGRGMIIMLDGSERWKARHFVN